LRERRERCVEAEADVETLTQLDSPLKALHQLLDPLARHQPKIVHVDQQTEADRREVQLICEPCDVGVAQIGIGRAGHQFATPWLTTPGTGAQPATCAISADITRSEAMASVAVPSTACVSKIVISSPFSTFSSRIVTV